MKAIYKKELKSYFHSLYAWLFLAVFTAVTGFYYSILCIAYGYADYSQYVFRQIPILFLIIVPILTMRLLSEEKKQKTDQLLYTAPITSGEIVLGKYLATLTLYALSLVICLIQALPIQCFGGMNWKTFFTGCIGYFLLGASLLAIGLFLSSLTENQLISAALTLGILIVFLLLPNLTDLLPGRARYSYICLFLLIIGIGLYFYDSTKKKGISAGIVILCTGAVGILAKVKPTIFDNGLSKIVDWFSVFSRYEDFCVGVLNASSIIYYISFVLIFLYLTVQIMERRRWK